MALTELVVAAKDGALSLITGGLKYFITPTGTNAPGVIPLDGATGLPVSPATAAGQASQLTALGSPAQDATVAASNTALAAILAKQPSSPALDGTDATGVTAPTGGVGVRGWLSGIYKLLSGTLAVSWSGQSVSISNFPSSQTVAGSVAVSNLPATQAISAAALPLPAGAAQDGTDATGVTQLAGGVGIRGWLSGIYSKLSGTLAVSGTFWQATQPVSIASMPMTTVTGTFWPATQPVSAAALPLPTGAATAALQSSIVTALGSPLQAGGNVTEANSAAILAKMIAAPATAANQSTEITALNQLHTDMIAATPAGTNIIGKVGIDQTTPGTTNGVQNTSLAAVATAALASSLILKSSAGNLMSLDAVVGATGGFLMLFDATSAPADGAVTPKWVYPIPASGALNMGWINPLSFATGIVAVFSLTGPFTKTASSTAFISGQVQ